MTTTTTTIITDRTAPVCVCVEWMIEWMNDVIRLTAKETAAAVFYVRGIIIILNTVYVYARYCVCVCVYNVYTMYDGPCEKRRRHVVIIILSADASDLDDIITRRWWSRRSYNMTFFFLSYDIYIYIYKILYYLFAFRPLLILSLPRCAFIYDVFIENKYSP